MNLDGTTTHNPCINHCLFLHFVHVIEQHTHTCSECNAFFQLLLILKICELRDQIFYLSHQTHKVFLNSQVNVNLLDLDEKGAVIF